MSTNDITQQAPGTVPADPKGLESQEHAEPAPAPTPEAQPAPEPQHAEPAPITELAPTPEAQPAPAPQPAPQPAPAPSTAQGTNIAPEKLRKAKRTKRTLIAVIVVLILLLVGGGSLGVYYYLTEIQDTTVPQRTELEPERLAVEDTVQDAGTQETHPMPPLALLLGRTTEEALALLGPNYTVTKTEGDTQGSTEPAPEGEPSSTTKQVVTISLTTVNRTTTVGATLVQHIYLSLNAAGITTEVYFASSLNLLDSPQTSFAQLVATDTASLELLRSAGVAAQANPSYVAPTAEQYTTWLNPTAASRKVTKETATIKGTANTAAPFINYEITLTYDYGASGIEDVPNKQPVQRMVYIKLW